MKFAIFTRIAMPAALISNACRPPAAERGCAAGGW